MPKKTKKPWPTKAAMEQIYAKNLWGGNSNEFYSGIGSHDPEIVEPYIAIVSQFLRSFGQPLTICDLGCGDFNIGKRLAPYTKKYIGVDIVESLIARNKKTFSGENLSFQCLDISRDTLPKADCTIIRQVLQHLSNQEIKQVVDKLSVYQYIILTEHLPEGNFVPNADIISGQGIRLKKQSGVNLLAPPFNLNILKERQLLSIITKKGKGIIATVLYQMF